MSLPEKHHRFLINPERYTHVHALALTHDFEVN